MPPETSQKFSPAFSALLEFVQRTSAVENAPEQPKEQNKNVASK